MALLRILSVLGALMLAGTIPADAGATTTLSFTGSLTESATATSTGASVALGLSDPDDPAQLLPPRELRLELDGGGIDTLAAPQCHATPESLAAGGEAACPPETKVGTGKAQFRLVGYSPDPAHENVAVFNAPGALLLLIGGSGPLTLVLDGPAAHSRITLDVPTLCLPRGAPPSCARGEAVLSRLSFDIPARPGPYIRTPESCDGSWVLAASVLLSDGTHRGGRATQPCTGSPPPLLPGRCANRLSGSNSADSLPGTRLGDRLLGLGGPDALSGFAGDDCLSGGSGDDRLSGGSGADTLQGGRGTDRFFGGAGNDTILARDGRREVVSCGPGRDTVRADSGDRLVGCERVG